MIESSWYFFGALLPLLVAFAAMFVWLQPWRPLSPASSAMGWGAALFDGYIISSVLHLVTKQPLPWPPVESPHILAMVILPSAAGVEILGAIPKAPRALVLLLRAAVVAATPPLLLLPFLQNAWAISFSVLVCAAMTAAMAALWALLDAAARRNTGRGPWLTMMIAAGGAGVTILASGSVIVGQLSLTLAATLLGAWFASLLIRGPIQLRGGLGLAMVLLSGLLINGLFYARLRPWQAALLAVTPLTAWVGPMPLVRRLSPWQRTLAAAILAALAVAAVAVPAIVTAAREAAETGYG